MALSMVARSANINLSVSIYCKSALAAEICKQAPYEVTLEDIEETS